MFKGTTSIIPPKYESKELWSRLKNEITPNVFSGSPYHFSQMCSRIDCPKLEHVFIGGATILPHFAKFVATRVNPKIVTLVYGSTEAEPMCTISLSEYLASIDAQVQGVLVGRQHHNIRLKINEMNSKDLKEVADGIIGEVIVAGPHVLESYFEDEDAFAANKVHTGAILWHKTVDAGYLKDGSLYIMGRQKHIWHIDGHVVAPLTMELFLSYRGYTEEGTWLFIEGRHVLFIQKTKNYDSIVSSFPSLLIVLSLSINYQEIRDI